MRAMDLLNKSSAIKRDANKKLVPINDALSFVANAFMVRDEHGKRASQAGVIAAIEAGSFDDGDPQLLLFAGGNGQNGNEIAVVLDWQDAKAFGDWIVEMFAKDPSDAVAESAGEPE